MSKFYELFFNHSCILVLFRSLRSQNKPRIGQNKYINIHLFQLFDWCTFYSRIFSEHYSMSFISRNYVRDAKGQQCCPFFRSEFNAKKNVISVSWVKRKKPPFFPTVTLDSMIIGSFCRAIACGMSTIIIVLITSAMVGSFRRATCELAKRRETPSSPRT